ncbi:unnamed protein product [Calypogeia fissa]
MLSLIIRVVTGFVRLIIKANTSIPRPGNGQERTERRDSERTPMATPITMSKEGDFVGLGPFGIIREAHKLWSTHFKFFSFIQLFFILPFAIAVMVSQAPWLEFPPEEGRPGPAGPTTDQNGITNSITNGGMDFIEYLLTVIIANSSQSDVTTVRIQWLLPLPSMVSSPYASSLAQLSFKEWFKSCSSCRSSFAGLDDVPFLQFSLGH